MKRRVKRHTVCQPLDQSYRLIPLTQGQNALVDTADFEWLNQFNWCAQWSPCTKSFYATRRECGNLLRMHREILGCKLEQEGDHKNHDTLDNRRHNLRKCTRSQNERNGTLRSNNKTGYVGVCWNKRLEKWTACIFGQGATIHLGCFSVLEDAARAYDEAATRFFGEFAHLNFPT